MTRYRVGDRVFPVRIQLSRKRGFKLQAASLALNGLPAVKVDRSTKWGNHWQVWRDDDGQWTCTRNGCQHHPVSSKAAGIAMAVEQHEKELRASLRGYGGATALLELRGHNLGCWCKPGDPCHADVLLELANK